MSDELVLYRGLRCPYGLAFRAVFAEHGAQHPDVPHSERVLDERDDAAWSAPAIRVSPTVVRLAGGREQARLEGKTLVGITRQRFRKWLDAPSDR